MSSINKKHDVLLRPQPQDQERDQDKPDEFEDELSSKDHRKYIMEMQLASSKPPPASNDDHVFGLWMGKWSGEPDDKARLQIEVLVLKWLSLVETGDGDIRVDDH